MIKSGALVESLNSFGKGDVGKLSKVPLVS